MTEMGFPQQISPKSDRLLHIKKSREAYMLIRSSYATHQGSDGYRPDKSAHQALAVTRQRCWWHAWVLEFDIRGLFDTPGQSRSPVSSWGGQPQPAL